MREPDAPPLPVAHDRARASGVRLWLVAAAALVAGILIGFYSGYETAARREPPADPAARTFTEGAVAEPLTREPDAPVRVDPEPMLAASPEPGTRNIEPEPEPEPVRNLEPGTRNREPVVRTTSGPGSLQVLSRPSGAQVILDGREIGRTPLVVSEVRAGRHDIRLALPGHRRWATTVDVTPGARTRVAASLEQ